MEDKYTEFVLLKNTVDAAVKKCPLRCGNVPSKNVKMCIIWAYAFDDLNPGVFGLSVSISTNWMQQTQAKKVPGAHDKDKQ